MEMDIRTRPRIPVPDEDPYFLKGPIFIASHIVIALPTIAIAIVVALKGVSEE